VSSCVVSTCEGLQAWKELPVVQDFQFLNDFNRVRIQHFS
jgi:hypothetical protein